MQFEQFVIKNDSLFINTDQNRPLGSICPYCADREIETAASAPYVRGLVLDCKKRVKNYIGCIPCVRRKVLGEAWRSCLVGWFSIPCIVANPFMIGYNLLQLPLISKNYAKARMILTAEGVVGSQENIDPMHLVYLLAVDLMKVDGAVDNKEMTVALKMGRILFPDFSEMRFMEALKASDLPSGQDTVSLLGRQLTIGGGNTLYFYLRTIAKADNHVSELKLNFLKEIAKQLDLDVKRHLY